MEHTNPTLFARTQGSGRPCQFLAGDTPEAQASDLMLSKQLKAGYCATCELSQAERVQLSDSARFSMDEEITMLRKMVKQFVRAAGTSGEDDFPDNLARSLDLLGLTCSRLASVLRVNMALSGSQDDDLRKQIEDSLASFLRESQEPACIQHAKRTKKQSKEAKDA